MTEAQIVYGSTIRRSNDGGTNWETIPETKSPTPPTVTTDYVDVTNVDSPNGFKEYLPGLRDAGELSISANWTQAGYVQQTSDQDSRNLILYEVTFSTGDVFTFEGYPTVSVDDNDIGDARMMTILIRTSGGVTHTPPSE